MGMTESLVEGWTLPLDFQLLKNDVPFTEEELTGVTLGLVLKDKSGAEVDTSGKVAWKAGHTSVAQFSPSSTDLLASKSPYKAHWKITDGNSKIFYVPNGEPDTWYVYKQ